MPDRRPWLFLDVDGVLNAYALTRRGSRRASSERRAFSDFRSVHAMGFELWLSPEMGRRLASLRVDIAWSTTWSPYVDDVIAGEVGLPRGLPVAATPPDDGSVPWRTNWKLTQVRAFLVGDVRPFVWIDDEALDEPGPEGATPREWAAALPVPSLLVAPSPTTGLQPRELDSIESWLDQLEARALPDR